MTRWDRDTAAELIQRHRVTGVIGITTMIVDFLANPELGKYDLSSHRAHRRRRRGDARSGGVEDREDARPAVPRGLRPDRDHRRPRTPTRRTGPSASAAAFPYFDTDSRVLDLATLQGAGPERGRRDHHPRPAGVPGLLEAGRRRRAEAFLEHDGKRFFRTGDLGYYDEEGYFFITDRLKRMINCSGFKVWPAEVEAMLYAHPDIQEACVIAAQDAHRGETVKAVVVLKSVAKKSGPQKSSTGRVRRYSPKKWLPLVNSPQALHMKFKTL